jgi:hypothetical protein
MPLDFRRDVFLRTSTTPPLPPEVRKALLRTCTVHPPAPRPTHTGPSLQNNLEINSATKST